MADKSLEDYIKDERKNDSGLGSRVQRRGGGKRNNNNNNNRSGGRGRGRRFNNFNNNQRQDGFNNFDELNNNNNNNNRPARNRQNNNRPNRNRRPQQNRNDRQNKPQGGKGGTFIRRSRYQRQGDDNNNNQGQSQKRSEGGVVWKKKLRVTGLHNQVTNQELYELFSKCGPLKKCRIDYDELGKSRGRAIIMFERFEDADFAIKEYNEAELDGHPIFVRRLQKKRENVRGRGGSNNIPGVRRRNFFRKERENNNYSNFNRFRSNRGQNRRN